MSSINFSFINDEEKKVNITITVELQAKHTRNGRCILAIKLDWSDWTDRHTHSLILGFFEGPLFGGFLTNSSEIRLLLILTYSF